MLYMTFNSLSEVNTRGLSWGCGNCASAPCSPSSASMRVSRARKLTTTFPRLALSYCKPGQEGSRSRSKGFVTPVLYKKITHPNPPHFLSILVYYRHDKSQVHNIKDLVEAGRQCRCQPHLHYLHPSKIKE